MKKETLSDKYNLEVEQHKKALRTIGILSNELDEKDKKFREFIQKLKVRLKVMCRQLEVSDEYILKDIDKLAGSELIECQNVLMNTKLVDNHSPQDEGSERSSAYLQPEDTKKGCGMCDGKKRINVSCPDGIKGCLVLHTEPCPKCSKKGEELIGTIKLRTNHSPQTKSEYDGIKSHATRLAQNKPEDTKKGCGKKYRYTTGGKFRHKCGVDGLCPECSKPDKALTGAALSKYLALKACSKKGDGE